MKVRWHKHKKTIKRLLLVAIISAMGLVGINLWVIVKATPHIITSADELAADINVALVPGTSNRKSDGTANPFFERRMQTAADLYHKNKISLIVVSGDNRTRYYNEPRMMKNALMKLNVPESAIKLDTAGLRTLDSITRCQQLTGKNKFIIVTQRFHCYRAIFIGLHYNINVVGFVVPERPEERSWKVYFREYFARAKAVLDLFILYRTTEK